MCPKIQLMKLLAAKCNAFENLLEIKLRSVLLFEQFKTNNAISEDPDPGTLLNTGFVKSALDCIFMY